VAEVATVAAVGRLRLRLRWMVLQRRRRIAIAIFFRPDWVRVGIVVAHSVVACQRIPAVSVGTRRARVADVATVAAIIERLWRRRRRAIGNPTLLSIIIANGVLAVDRICADFACT